MIMSSEATSRRSDWLSHRKAWLEEIGHVLGEAAIDRHGGGRRAAGTKRSGRGGGGGGRAVCSDRSGGSGSDRGQFCGDVIRVPGIVDRLQLLHLIWRNPLSRWTLRGSCKSRTWYTPETEGNDVYCLCEVYTRLYISRVLWINLTFSPYSQKVQYLRQNFVHCHIQNAVTSPPTYCSLYIKVAALFSIHH